MDWHERISWDPEVCHGQACVKGTRVMVPVVLDNLAAGRTLEQILKSYPTLTADDVLACISYAAALSRERVIQIAGGVS